MGDGSASARDAYAAPVQTADPAAEIGAVTRVTRRVWEVFGDRRSYVGALIIVFVFRMAMFLVIGRYSKLTGDEGHYWRRTRQWLHIVGLERIDGMSFGDAVDRIVSRGWFLPGMSILLSPARLISDDIAFARAWVALIAFGLLLFVAQQLRQMFSTQIATLFVLIVGVLPYTAWFSMTLWGGSTGGLLMVLNMLWVTRMAMTIKEGGNPRVQSLALLGLSVGFTVLVRPPTLGQLFPIAVMLFVPYADRLGFLRAIPASAWRMALVVVMASLMIAPWQIALMQKFDGPFFLVTSSPMNEILRFGTDEELAEVGTNFGQVANYLTELSEERDESFYSVTMSERDRILADVTLSERTSTINRSMHRFFDGENSFLSRAVRAAQQNKDNPLSRDTVNTIGGTLKDANTFGWVSLTILVLYALFRRWPAWEAMGLLGIGMRAMFVLLMYQPLTRSPHGRHISYLVPMFVIFALLAIERRVRGDDIARDSLTRYPVIERHVATAFTALVAFFLIFYFVG